MFTHTTFLMATGERVDSNPVPLRIPLQPAAALAFAAKLDRQADFALAEGRTAQADRLSHMAHDLRCRVSGAPA